MAQKDSKEIEKLLELVEDDSFLDIEPKKVDIYEDVDRFISFFKIQDGPDFVPNLIIYYTYCLYRDRNRTNKNPFFRRFKQVFEAKFRNGERGYMLDNSDGLFDISIENKFQAREFFKRSRQQREYKKEKNKKK